MQLMCYTDIYTSIVEVWELSEYVPVSFLANVIYCIVLISVPMLIPGPTSSEAIGLGWEPTGLIAMLTCFSDSDMTCIYG